MDDCPKNVLFTLGIQPYSLLRSSNDHISFEASSKMNTIKIELKILKLSIQQMKVLGPRVNSSLVFFGQLATGVYHVKAVLRLKGPGVSFGVVGSGGVDVLQQLLTFSEIG